MCKYRSTYDPFIVPWLQCYVLHLHCFNVLHSMYTTHITQHHQNLYVTEICSAHPKKKIKYRMKNLKVSNKDN